MKLTLNVLQLFIILIMCGCSAGFSRTGYKVEDVNVERKADCNVVIKNDYQYDQSSVEKLGEIKAYDTQFSLNCAENYVLSVFETEACSLNADLINITEETYPNWWSSCYRASAELIRFKDKKIVQKLETDSKYAPTLVQNRSKETGERNRRMINSAIMGGMSVPVK